MKNRKSIIAAIILVVLMAAMFFLYQAVAPKTKEGSKAITVTVVHFDKSEKKFTYHTDEEFLGKVLTDEKLVEGENGQYGLFITKADGEAADNNKKQFWAITKGGKQVNTSADTTPINDGDEFELTLTTY